MEYWAIWVTVLSCILFILLIVVAFYFYSKKKLKDRLAADEREPDAGAVPVDAHDIPHPNPPFYSETGASLTVAVPITGQPPSYATVLTERGEDEEDLNRDRNHHQERY